MERGFNIMNNVPDGFGGNELNKEWLKDIGWKNDFSNAKSEFDFFAFLTDEMWIEYNAYTDILKISRSAAEKFGLEEFICFPLKNKKLVSYFGRKEIENIVRIIRDFLLGKVSFCDETITLCIDKNAVKYRLCMKSGFSGNKKTVFGRLRLIDDNIKALEKIEKIDGKSKEEFWQDYENQISVTAKVASDLINYFKRMFTVVRLVDPDACIELTCDAAGRVIEKPYRCYSEWNKDERCDKCISSIVAKTKKPITKTEIVDNQVYNVSASYIVIEERAYVLELASYVDHDSLLSAGEKNEVLSAIASHNRRLYVYPVTGVYNRRYFDDKLRDLNGQFAFAMIDVDNFKKINDTYGHLAGDAALSAVAQTIKKNVRSCDDVIRYGGDEFFLFFRDMQKKNIKKKLEEILKSIGELRINEYPDLRITISIGGAYEEGKLSQILRKADIAMYTAKNTRNSVAMYQELD